MSTAEADAQDGILSALQARFARRYLPYSVAAAELLFEMKLDLLVALTSSEMMMSGAVEALALETADLTLYVNARQRCQRVPAAKCRALRETLASFGRRMDTHCSTPSWLSRAEVRVAASNVFDTASSGNTQPSAGHKEDGWLDIAEEFVTTLYAPLGDGFDAAVTTSATSVENKGDDFRERTFDAALYGELTSRGVRQTLALLNDAVGTVGSGDDFDFVDLGSGTGKVVLDVAALSAMSRRAAGDFAVDPALPLMRSVAASYGIELDETRAGVADDAARLLADVAVHAPALSAPNSAEAGVANLVYGIDCRSLPKNSAAATAPQLANGVSAVELSCQQGDMVEWIDAYRRGHYIGATATRVAAMRQPSSNTQLIVFCCGVAFDRPFVVRLLQALFSPAAACSDTTHHSLSGGGDCASNRVVAGGVFLIREWPWAIAEPPQAVEEPSVHSLRAAFAARGLEVRSAHVSTTWMDEAPAFVVGRWGSALQGLR
jgi:hypothetical protein